MNRTKSDRDYSGIPSWQSEKMRSLIVERWQEVWEVVEAREKAREESQKRQREKSPKLLLKTELKIITVIEIVPGKKYLLVPSPITNKLYNKGLEQLQKKP